MASDTSPVSSGSNANPIGNSVGNQNGISVGNPVPQLSTVQITQPNPEVHNPVPVSTRLQSVLTSQLSQNPALPVSVPVSAPVSLQVANQSSAQADELNNANSAFSQQTLISLEGIAKALAPQRTSENSLQAEMVLRNLAEIGKQISMNNLLNQATQSVSDAGASKVLARKPSPSPSPSPSSPDTPPPRPKKSRKESKKSKNQEKKTFKKRKDFQRAVIETAKEAIKPAYKSRRIDKGSYKKIMKDLVRKVVSTSKTYTLDKSKVTRLVEKYIERYSNPGTKKKAEMLNYFNEEDGKSEGSDGPDGLQHLFAPGQTDLSQYLSNRSAALTIPSNLPLPPPPPKQPPPRQFGHKSKF